MADSATHLTARCVNQSEQINFVRVFFNSKIRLIYLVYYWCMSRTNIDIDENLCRIVMDRYQLGTKREAVNLALRLLASEPLDLEDARGMRGSGWEGDLVEMRENRS